MINIEAVFNATARMCGACFTLVYCVQLIPRLNHTLHLLWGLSGKMLARNYPAVGLADGSLYRDEAAAGIMDRC